MLGIAYEQWRADVPKRRLVFEKWSCCLWGVGDGVSVDTHESNLSFIAEDFATLM
jgi:hypothetical protein